MVGNGAIGLPTKRARKGALDTADMELPLAQMLDDKLARWALGEYRACALEEVEAGLRKLYCKGEGDVAGIENVRRLSGGSSKEQFVFDLQTRDNPMPQKLVLRMDPRGGTVETLRSREAEVLEAVKGLLPAPQVTWVDEDGNVFGRPAMVTRWVDGVTSPSGDGARLSGLGTTFPEALRVSLSEDFMACLAAVHETDFRSANLPSFSVPEAGSVQTALWQVNFWSRVWREDRSSTSPLFAMTEAWLRENLPVCERPVLLHGDYRMGNFMFDEGKGRITAVLDWELAHIGDYHEDVSYNLQPVFCTPSPNGNRPVGGMFGRDEYLAAYERASGNTINAETLHFYDVLNTYKLAIMNHASAASAAREGVNHQNVYLSYISAISHVLVADLPSMLRGKWR
ncbi:MAG: phosphotransferase family protein [Novosphingobium sp.]